MFSGMLAPSHVIILLAVVLLFFGPKRLPEMGRGLGKGLREFKHSIDGSTPEPPAAPEPVAVIEAEHTAV